MKTILANNQAIRILLFSPMPTKDAFGGISSWTVRFLNKFKNLHNVLIENIDSTPVDKRGKDIARSRNLFKKISCNYRIYKEFKKKVATFKPNILHFNSSCTPFACLRDYVFLRYCKKKKINCILHCRCNIEDQLCGNKIGIYFFKKNLKLSSAIITLNNFSFNYASCLKRNSDNLFIVPNFVDEKIILDKKIVRNHLSKIVFVGHLVKQKGIQEIIELAKLFPDVEFVIVGGFTEDYPEKSIFPKNVDVTGNLPFDLVIKRLDEADVFLFPTYTEGFSNALLEAMARGLPVIASNVGANRDMIENYGGIIVDSNEVNELAEAIVHIRNVNVRLKMSAWNIDKVKNTYTSDVVINYFLHIYSSLV